MCAKLAVCFRIVDIENNKTLITYDYPSDTRFTAVWSEDSYYCAIGYNNKEESRTVVFITRIGTPTTGKAIISSEVSSFTNSIHPKIVDAHIVPTEFMDKSTLLLSVDWIDADGNRNVGTATWDFIHGTYTEITK